MGQPPPGGGGVLPYMALTGTSGQKGYGFQCSFVLNGVWDFITFCLKQGIFSFKREARTLKFVKMVQKAEFLPFFAGADASHVN